MTMKTQSASDLLAELESLRSILEKDEFDMQAEIDRQIPAEVKARIDEIKASFAPALEILRGEESDLTLRVKDAVIAEGHTVTGKRLIARYNRGRVSWDTLGLSGYAVAHPEILTFKNEGLPYVSLVEKKP